MILHIVSVSPLASTGFADCLGMASPNDAIILIENGVYAAISPQIIAPAPCPIFVLEADLTARGLTQQKLKNIKLVDYSGWVELTATFPKSLSWYQ